MCSGAKTSFFTESILQLKPVQSEGLFGRRVSTQTSEINYDKRLNEGYVAKLLL